MVPLHAIPINEAKTILPQLLAAAHVTRGYLGVSIQSLTSTLATQLGVPDTTGVVVARVQGGSPAAAAGLPPGDVIVAANQKAVPNVAALRQVLAAQTPGQPTLLQIHRKDASLFVAVTAQG